MRRTVDSPAAVLVTSLLGTAAFVSDAASGEATLGLAGLALMVAALAFALAQAARARVGRPWRTSRRAATAGTAGSLFVVVFLLCVGVLERMGPEVTSSAVFSAGVAVLSVVLLVVLPLALVVLGWALVRDRRLVRHVRLLPWALVLVVALTAVALAVTRGDQELWLNAAGVAVAAALLIGFSAGLPRPVSRRG